MFLKIFIIFCCFFVASFFIKYINPCCWWTHWNGGIQKINYLDKGFSSLWQTLEEWATKAEDEEKWQEKILKLAEQEPKALKLFILLGGFVGSWLI
jgi:hypothetical protein